MRAGYYVISILGQVGQVVKLVNMNWFARIVKHYQQSAYQTNLSDSLYPICRLKGGWTLIHLQKWFEICQMPIKISDSMNLFILRTLTKVEPEIKTKVTMP